LFRFGSYTNEAGQPTWNETIAGLPGAHLLQTYQWGVVKIDNGWSPSSWAWQDDRGAVVAAALILQRRLSTTSWFRNLSVLYLPKGPLLDWSDLALRRQVLADLADLGRRIGAIFIKLDPDVKIGTGIQGQAGARESELGASVLSDLRAHGWHISDEQVQFRNTVLIDLTLGLDQLLANMKQKPLYSPCRWKVLCSDRNVSIRWLYKLYIVNPSENIIRDWKYYRPLVYHGSRSG
jgi:lipid II:glycine glycyltransferase (peptidoglycan interpeptide bridge formation enzyme)